MYHYNIILGAMEQPSIPDGAEQHPVPDGMACCEKCGILGNVNSFMKPFKRFCSSTCCRPFPQTFLWCFAIVWLFPSNSGKFSVFL